MNYREEFIIKFPDLYYMAKQDGLINVDPLLEEAADRNVDMAEIAKLIQPSCKHAAMYREAFKEIESLAVSLIAGDNMLHILTDITAEDIYEHMNFAKTLLAEYRVFRFYRETNTLKEKIFDIMDLFEEQGFPDHVSALYIAVRNNPS